MVAEGDIVEIPLPKGRTAIGWVLHVSERFKDALGFVVFGIKGTQCAHVNFDPLDGRPIHTKVFGPLYTHAKNPHLSGWRIIGNQPISDSARLLTKREVGGNVYIGDQCIGTIEDLGQTALKPMLAMGMPIIYEEIERAFNLGDVKRTGT
jgi:hypothetical protein